MLPMYNMLFPSQGLRKVPTKENSGKGHAAAQQARGCHSLPCPSVSQRRGWPTRLARDKCASRGTGSAEP